MADARAFREPSFIGPISSGSQRCAGGLLSDRYLVLIPDCAVSEMPFISVMTETSRVPQHYNNVALND
jgi:hypothetical protein